MYRAAHSVPRVRTTGQGNIFKPEYALSSFESKEAKIEAHYKMGYLHGKERMDELRAFLEDKRSLVTQKKSAKRKEAYTETYSVRFFLR